MNAKNVKLRGLIGIADGLHRQEVSLDLSTLRGVVALIGPNGKGKTTFLECLQPFRMLPSRGILLKDAVNLRDSFKDLTLDYKGKEYRILVTADSMTGKMDGYLWEDGVPLTTGKVTELDEQLIKLFGSTELFFASSFATQSAESMLSLKPSKRKDFFVEFLGLGQLQVYSERAKAVAGYYAGVIEGMRDTIVRLERESAGIETHEEDRKKANERISVLTPAAERTSIDLAELEKSIGSIELKLSEQETIRRSVKALDSRRAEIQQAFETHQGKLRGDLKKKQDFVTAAGVELANWTRELAALENATEPPQPEESTNPPQPSPRSAEIREEIKQIDEAISKNRMASEAVALELQTLQLKYRTYMAELEGKKSAATNLAALSSKIPATADRTICSDCGFAKAALLAVNDEKAVEQKMLESKTRYDEQLAVLTAKRNAIPSNDDLMISRRTLNADIELIAGLDREALTKYGQLQKRIDEARRAVTAFQEQRRKIDTIKTSMTHRESQVQETNEECNALMVQMNVNHAQLVERLKEMDAEIMAEKDRLQGFLVDGMDPEKAIEAVRQNVAGLKSRLKEQSAEIETQKIAVGVLTNKITRCLESTASLETSRAKMIELDQQRAEWDLLRQICGRDKLQALELDAAAPAITTIANNLLGECFGGRFAVKFVTMDEDGKEVFDLIVTDMESGAQTALAMKSGGQKVIVLHALRLAITMYAKEKSGRDFRSMFLDECDGALSSDVRREFVDMNRRAMQMGGFDTLYMVSHSPEVIDSVDRTIEFTESEILVH